ncbi:TIR domain-containing protein [Acinetobacter tianfuensis]|uniref:CD-NTase-associated protein 12/Pycsar effector protein TIR domain-containing protein n=1 Tax=Acinetobacter tianfuensis TaxID=2419603 RepID=A0A3A8EI49_9GAMM|nr:nucleotide-binding protein [Acinetobacter tianfuensis]RKG30420.1 hypothetical protein D7V32_11195 [Acinetobacter tianfuensis]
MDKLKLIEELTELQVRLNTEVRQAHAQDSSLGEERLQSWFRAAKKILNPYSADLYQKLVKKPIIPMIFSAYDYSALNDFDENTREPLCAFIDSLIRDIENDEFEWIEEKVVKPKNIENKSLLKKAFIVHGHDNATKERTARYLEKLGFEAVILHEQASGGKTIIEKLEHYTDVGFCIVLYTPDDEGSVKDKKDYKPRARQNVVFEHGLLIGKLGRNRVFPLVTDHSVELPGDINGMVYLSDSSWELQLAKEIRGIGFEVDMNKVI